MEKQHFIYKITNKINGRFYIGMHTGFPDDGYFGSGKRIKAEIKKYGRENFLKEILETVCDRKSLELREAKIVNEELLSDPLCLNLKNGGEGGGKKWSDEHQRIWSSAGGKVSGKKMGPINGSQKLKKMHGAGVIPYDNFRNKKHSTETKRRMSEIKKNNGHGIGSKNSQFGVKRVGINKDGKIKKVLPDQIELFLSDGWKRGFK